MKIILIFTSAFVALSLGHSFDRYPDIYEPNYLKKSHDEGRLLVQNTEDFRLTDDAVPFYYNLTLTPFITKQKHFLGEVEIFFTATKASNKIVLNQENLKITSYKLSEGRVWPEKIELTGCNEIDEYQKIECTLAKKTLKPSFTYQLYFTYEGVVHDDMRGFYESYYIDERNETQTFGTTHFGQQARRLMPCFDEPRFKAQFQLNIGRNPKIHSQTIANTKRDYYTRVNDSWMIDEFKPTTIISPSLLAFVISDFRYRSDKKFSVYARPNAIDQVEFALELGPLFIRVFSVWNGISYYDFKDVEKIEVAAIPDYSVGTMMGNLGLILHREKNLLYKSYETNEQQVQQIALTLSHEIAHMWFGGYVTCDAIWLNEGLATYLQFIGVDQVQRDWNVMDNFVVSTLHNALSTDAVRSSPSLSNSGVNDDTHYKGASLFRMMDNLMSKDRFQRAVKNYLEKHQYNTTVPADLFNELQDSASNFESKEIMESYTKQSGYPLVSVKRGVKQDRYKLLLTQKRFLIDEIDHNLTSKWTIPITYATSEDDFLNTRSYLDIFRSESLNISFYGAELDYYILNVQQVGFYRVNYDTTNWLAISKALKSFKHGRIHVLNRAQIIDDLFNLARAGYLTYDFILNIIDYVKDEQEYLPWQATLNGLSYLMQRIPDDENYKNISYTFVNDLLSRIYKEGLFHASNIHQETIYRINILNWACKYGTENCQDSAMERFYDFVKKNETFNPDLRPAVYCTGLRNTTGYWDTFWEHYINTNYASEQATILTALGCTKNEKEINKFLDKILSDEIRLQDKSSAYYSAYTGNLENIDIVYNYITQNHEEWSEVMDLGSTLSDLANRFTTTAQVEKLEKFIAGTKLTEDVKTKLKAAVSQSKKNLEWDSRRLKEVKSYFDARTGSAGTIKMMKFFVLVLAIINVVLF